MKLVDAYLVEVSRFLPEDSRADVIDELRASIEDQVTEQAAGSGRAPEPDDERTVLGAFGHPLKIASAYQPQRYLIGPGLFGSYVEALRFLLIAVLSLQVAIALAVGIGSGWTLSGWGLFSQALSSAVWVAAIVTGVFVAIERSGERLDWYASWRPDTLRAGPVTVANRTDLITNIVTEGVFLLWWNDVLVLDNWVPLIGEHLSLSSAWEPLFWPLNVLMATAFVAHTYVLVVGLWRRATLILEILLNVMIIVLGAALFFEDTLVDVATASETATAVGASVQRVVKVALGVIAGIVVWDLWLAGRNLRVRHGGGA